MLIFVVTIEVSGAGIYMPIVIVVKVVLSFIIGHSTTSFGLLLSLSFRFSYANRMAQRQMDNVSRLAVG
jgi:hypothetical protein